MNAALNFIWDKCDYYYQNLPKDLVSSVGRSAIFSFTVTFLVANTDAQLFIKPILNRDIKHPDFSSPLEAGLAAGTASLIHYLTTPLFNAIFGDREVTFEREIVKWAVNLSCAYLILSQFNTTRKVDLAWVLFTQTISANLTKAWFDIVPRFLRWVDPSLSYLKIPIEEETNSAYYSLVLTP